MKEIIRVSFLILIIYINFGSCDTETEDNTEAMSTVEPGDNEELSFGCPPPSIRFSRVRKTDPTHSPIFTYETTQIYLPEDFASDNLELVGHLGMDSINRKSQLAGLTNNNDLNNRKTRYTDISSYLWDDQIKNLRSSSNNNSNNNKKIKRNVKKILKFNDIHLEDNLKGDLGENDLLVRKKRKSGKTTGALSRPKADSGSSKSATSNRKVQSGNYDEESGGVIPHPDEETSSSESHEDNEHETSSEETNFREVNEVRFPGEVGPMGDRRLCKIKCIKGKWIGPLCATTEEDGTGNMNFQPLYKSCYIDRLSTHLLLSYKNVSVALGWVLPHGHSLQARCDELGMHKLLGESRVLCSNGLWAPRMPSCVPTTLLTNYSDDSPPTVKIKIGIGSGAVEPSGVLAILPGSTIYLDCLYPRRRGTPEWTWTGWFRQYLTGWSVLPEEKGTNFRLTIKDIQNQDSGTFTCASPRGLTNSIIIVVTVSTCPTIPDAQHPLSLQLEGNKLGEKAIYNCPLGYILKGTANSTCLASGNWSSPPPLCHPVQCPSLVLEDPHLSLVELNASAWGRAVFSCSWGYKLNGPPGVECEPVGIWSGPVPRCRAIQCPQPLVPINGRIDGASSVSTLSGPRRYAVGALVTFSCSDGHSLEGEASIVCTETGFWSHPPPFCKSQCSYPGDPPNGLIAPLKFHYDPGDTLSVQCRPGFVEVSVTDTIKRPTCLSDGNWSTPVPQCKNYEEI